MANPLFRVHGAGCGLGDLVHPSQDFHSPLLKPYLSRPHPAPGGPGRGLEMGQVVFIDDLAAFSGRSREAVLADLEALPATFMPGGPALVSMTLAAQLLRPERVAVTYYGLSGDDAAASRIRTTLARTPLDMSCYRQRAGRTPVTHAFSDAAAQGGHGDRGFAHDPGVEMTPELLGETFFQATFNVYAGTALTPALHAALPGLLAKSRRRGAITVAGSVFDCHAERAGRPWTLGGEEAWGHLDLLVADAEEIVRLGGRPGVEDSVDALLAKGLNAAVITCGPDPIYYKSVGGVFGNSRGYAPASATLAALARDRTAHPGDTTGAGDNFLGALIAAFLFQILSDEYFSKGEVHLERELFHIVPLQLRKAIDFAALAGGLACLHYGGIRLEKSQGERLAQIRSFQPEPEPSALPWK